MPKNKLFKAYTILGAYALLFFLLHSIVNNYYTFLDVSTELSFIHLTIFVLYATVFGISKWLINKHSSYKPLIILGGLSFKMLMIIALILIFYFTIDNNTKPFIYSLFAVYILYMPVLSYFYIKDL